MTDPKPYDVVVLGATALTAREVCAYLGRRAAEVGLTWAAAGRDPERVRRALSTAGVTPDGVLTADVGDPVSLRELTRSAAVVLNLVGPYARTADAVIGACVEGGADYLDLTGETLFMRRMIERHDAAAREAGVRVVQPCGFESLPADLLLGEAWKRADEAGLGDVTAFDLELTLLRRPRCLRPGDAVSGGTVRSLTDMLVDDEVGRVHDPALLVQDPARADVVRRVSPLTLRPRRSASSGVLSPFLPAPTINPPVMHRTAELLGRPPLRYREGSRVPAPLPLALPAAASLSVFYGATRALAGSPRVLRRAVDRVIDPVLPGSGSGPSADKLPGWEWRLDGLATTSTGQSLEVGLTGTGHPGYLATAHMCAEAALVLASGAGSGRVGLLTPLAALGDNVTERFAHAGLVLDH